MDLQDKLLEVLSGISGDHGGMMDLANRSLKQGRYDDAARQYTSVLSETEDDGVRAAAYQGLGFCQIREMHFAEAIDSLEKAKEIVPEEKLVRNNLGWAYFKRRRFDEAEAEMTAACELDPEFAQPVHNLGWIFCRRKEYEKAIEAMSKAIAMKEVPRWHNDIAVVYDKAGDRGAAEMHRVRYRALTTEPDLTLEDEVTALLDPGSNPEPTVP